MYETLPHQVSPQPSDPREIRRAVACSTVGNIIEAYDFLVYALMAAIVFPKVFFPSHDTFAATVFSFSTYFVAFLARPVGAAIFGHFGDKIGRKKTLVATVLLMGIATVGVGFVPSYEAIGPSSVFILIFLRVLAGIAIGGEWSGAVLLAMESAPEHRRGFLTSFTQAANPLGMALANGAILAVTLTLTPEQLQAWGWRIPFLASIVLVIVGVWMRIRVHETVEFLRAKSTRKEAIRYPVAEVFKRQPYELLLCILVKAAEAVPYYVFTVFILSYGRTHGFSAIFLTALISVAALVCMVTFPLFGHLGDRFGHERVFAVGSGLAAVYAFIYLPLFGMGGAGPAIAAVIFSLLPFAAMMSVEGVILAKVFDTQWRYSGSSLAMTLAGIVGPGAAPLIAAFLTQNDGTVGLALYLGVVGVIGVVASSILYRRTTRNLGRVERKRENVL
jgi:MFS family permease